MLCIARTHKPPAVAAVCIYAFTRQLLLPDQLLDRAKVPTVGVKLILVFRQPLAWGNLRSTMMPLNPVRVAYTGGSTDLLTCCT